MKDLSVFKNLINNKHLNLENFDYKDNESFCMAPWIHLNISPNGNVPLCCNCLNTKDTILGNVNENSLEDIWNSEVTKKIRLKMLKGEKIRECSSCYDREKVSRYSSLRNAFNDRYFPKYKDIVKSTKANGEVKDFNVVYFDFRFSNKCNFSCRSCGPHYSSTWEKKLNYNIPKINNTREVIDKSKELILNDVLEEIYFAGGEPLITDEHWEIIDFLIEHKKFDMLIRYNTNLSVLKYKNNDFVEKLKLFKRVVVSPSCDSLGIRGEYIRTGFSSENFVKNINKLKDNNLYYYLTTVLSFFNITYLYDFMSDLKNNGISYNDLHFIILTNTDPYSLYNLPPEMHERALQEIDKVINADFISEDKKTLLTSVSNSLKENYSFNLNKFKGTINLIKMQDDINKLKFNDCFPELYDLISKYF
jgi:radical SAM protein with 4Fe4S-binding SPASM domain